MQGRRIVHFERGIAVAFVVLFDRDAVEVGVAGGTGGGGNGGCHESIIP